MAILVETFTANSENMTILLTSDAPLESALLLLTDGTSEDILDQFNPTVNPNEYEAIITADYSDGVFVLDVRNGADTYIVSICNLLLGTQYLTKQTIDEIFDCVLMQQLEAIKQLVLANQGDLAQSIYFDVQNKAASCSEAPMLGYNFVGTSVWIEDSKYVIV